MTSTALFTRGLLARLQIALLDTPAIYLGGARQVGKSTLAIASAGTGNYVTFDDLNARTAALYDPEAFLGEHIGQGPLVLDEVQRVPDLLLAVKVVIDRDRQPGRFILTGSANILTLPRISETLAGRMELLSVFPLARCELQHRTSPLGAILAGEPEMPASLWQSREALIEDAKRGGFPEVVKRAAASRRSQWFRSYVATTLTREIREIANVGDDGNILQLLRMIAGRSGTPRNIESLSHDGKIPATTLRRYLDLLATIYLVENVPAWFVNSEKRITKQPKLLLVDTGLYTYLMGASLNVGQLLEHYVGCQLRSLLAMDKNPGNLFHFRTNRGAEVDWVIEDSDGRIIGCEVKAATSITTSDFRGLHELREAAKAMFHLGIVFYTGEKIIRFGPNMLAIPISAL